MNHHKTRINKQLRQNKALSIIRHFYRNHSAKKLSADHRKRLALEDELDKSLTYGEVDPASFMQILQYTTNGEGFKNFVDLGSGSGLACVCAALSPFEFSSVTGIEIVPGLVDLATSIEEQVKQFIDSPPIKPVDAPKGAKNAAKEIELLPLVGEILEENNQVASTERLVDQLCQKIGHKSYRASIKKFHSFSKFLDQHSHLFHVSDDGKEVTLIQIVDHDNNSKEDDQEEITDQLDPSSSSFARLPTWTVEEKQLFQLVPFIDYITGSIFDHPWYVDADIVYAASLLFSESMMQQLLAQVCQMKTNSWLITLKPLPLCKDTADPTYHPSFERVQLVQESFYKMSWQMAKVYFYRLS